MHRVIDDLLDQLKEMYEFLEIVQKTEEAIRQRQSKGKYDGITDRAACAYTLTSHLREVSRGEHLEVAPFEIVPTAGVKTLIGKIQTELEAPKVIGENHLSPAMLAEDPSCFLYWIECLPNGVSYVGLPAFPSWIRRRSRGGLGCEQA